MTVTLQCCYDVTVAAAVADERIMLYPTMEGRGTSAIFHQSPSFMLVLYRHILNVVYGTIYLYLLDSFVHV